MTLAFQLVIFALIATSLIILISVPVVFASPDGWSRNKNAIFSGTSLCIGLVFLVGILNSLISCKPICSRGETEMTPKNFSRLRDVVNFKFNISPQNKEQKKRGGQIS